MVISYERGKKDQIVTDKRNIIMIMCDPDSQ